MGRAPCCDNGDRNKGAWTTEEDERLTQYIQAHGEGCWRSLPKAAGLLRCGKSCRLRWINYLRPDLKRGNFSEDEEDLIFKLHALLGNKWSLIAGRLPGRTDNEIKNYWNSHLKRKLLSRGVDPKTHRPFYKTIITPDQKSTKQDVLTQPKSEIDQEKCSGETVDEVVQSSEGELSEQRITSDSHNHNYSQTQNHREIINLNLELSITSPSTYSTAREETVHSHGSHGCHGKDELNGLNSVGCYVDFPRTMLLLR